MVDELSALGLRHVGYNVPVEFFGPFVNACIDTLEGKASAEVLATCPCRHSQRFWDFFVGSPIFFVGRFFVLKDIHTQTK